MTSDPNAVTSLAQLGNEADDYWVIRPYSINHLDGYILLARDGAVLAWAYDYPIEGETVTYVRSHDDDLVTGEVGLADIQQDLLDHEDER